MIVRKIGFGALALVLVTATLALTSNVANAGETSRPVEAELTLRLTPTDIGCSGTWWLEVDDIERAAEYVATVTRTSPPVATTTVTFNKFTIWNNLAGTQFDWPAPPGKLHVPIGTAGNDAGGAPDACENLGIQQLSLDGVVVTEFTMDPVQPGKAAFEAISVPTGNGPGGCQMFVWVSVPDIPGASEYTIEYLATTLTEPRLNTLTLTPAQFEAAPSANSLGVKPYDTPGRLGHFLFTTARSSGCPALEWTLFEVQTPHIIASSLQFDVVTRRCFGRQPTIFAVPGVPTVGTSGNDVIWGTRGADEIRGRGGNDRICSLGGGDNVFGGGGNDRINLGSGADKGKGGSGKDRVLGKGGADRIRGGGGADILAGGGGADRIFGQGGNDVIDGGTGNDVCRGGRGFDVLRRC